MSLSYKKYLNPSEVLKQVVDDSGSYHLSSYKIIIISSGQYVDIGEQKDFTEYFLNFLSRIEEAFYYQDKYHKV